MKNSDHLIPTGLHFPTGATLLATMLFLTGCGGGGTSAQYTIGGTLSGLTGGQQVTLMDNADTGHALTLSANGSFSFPVSVGSGASYAVTVGTQPTQQICM